MLTCEGYKKAEKFVDILTLILFREALKKRVRSSLYFLKVKLFCQFFNCPDKLFDKPFAILFRSIDRHPENRNWQYACGLANV